MPPSSDDFLRVSLVGVFLVSTTLGANALTVSRCNILSDGVYVPALVVESDGQTFTHFIGDDGLTRRTVFNPDAALGWALAKYGGDAATSTYGACLGNGATTGGGTPVLATAGPGDDDDDDYGGDDDDYGGDYLDAG